MNITFTKAQASGNDFVILDNRTNKLTDIIDDFGSFAKSVCRRRYSVGADGVLVLENSNSSGFKMRIFNPDGREVEMCGNGIRCSALYAYTNKWCGTFVEIETGTGILEAEINGESIKIKMTPPNNIKLNQNVRVGKQTIDIHTVNTGVPHVVHFVKNIESYPVKETGREIRYHKLFEPEGTNADFVEILNKSTIMVRTYERGVEDETFACGTGVVASAIISNLVKGTLSPLNVITKSKETLRVYFKKEEDRFHDVYFEGKAYIIFEGGMNYV